MTQEKSARKVLTSSETPSGVKTYDMELERLARSLARVDRLSRDDVSALIDAIARDVGHREEERARRFPASKYAARAV